MKWEACWKTNDGTDFGDILSVVDQLKIAFEEKDSSKAKGYYDPLLPDKTDLNERLKNFSSSCENMSEVCRYWEGFLEIVSILKVLIAADREGDWQAIFKQTEPIASLQKM